MDEDVEVEEEGGLGVIRRSVGAAGGWRGWSSEGESLRESRGRKAEGLGAGVG